MFFKNALLYYILVWVKQKCCVSHTVNTCTIISNFDTSHTWWWRKGPSGPIFTKNCEVRTVHIDHYKSIVGQESSYSAILHSAMFKRRKVFSRKTTIFSLQQKTVLYLSARTYYAEIGLRKYIPSSSSSSTSACTFYNELPYHNGSII